MAATQPSSRPVLQVVQRSDPGLDPQKQVNEDACGDLLVPIGHVMVVCDGMGGHVGGKQASETAVKTILQDLDGGVHAGEPGARLQAAIEHAAELVYALGTGNDDRMRPGSTVVALLSHVGGTEVAHVGDSRGYLIREGQTYALTKDHSMVQEMVDAGMLTPEQAAVHPDANKITRALGMHPSVQVELRPVALEHHKGDIFLLASDGLCDLVAPQELAPLVMQARSARGLAFAADQLVALANARGGHDNITVLLAEVMEAPPVPKLSPKPNKPSATVPLLPAADVLGADAVAERTTQPGGPPIQLVRGGAQATVPDVSAGAQQQSFVKRDESTIPVAPALEGGTLVDTVTTEAPGGTPPTKTWTATEVGNERPGFTDGPGHRLSWRWIVTGLALLLVGVLLLLVSVLWLWWSWSKSAPSSTLRFDTQAVRTMTASASPLSSDDSFACRLDGSCRVICRRHLRDADLSWRVAPARCVPCSPTNSRTHCGNFTQVIS